MRRTCALVVAVLAALTLPSASASAIRAPQAGRALDDGGPPGAISLIHRGAAVCAALAER
jgi:hypothetical protein